MKEQEDRGKRNLRKRVRKGADERRRYRTRKEEEKVSRRCQRRKGGVEVE